MKRILLFILIFYCAAVHAQNQVPRGGGSQTLVDSNLFTGKSFRVPIFPDTTNANTYKTLDSAGKIIFTRDINWFWGRQTSPSRKWVPFNNPPGQINASCGNPTGTHAVTYDSLLIFSVTGGPYVLCCDNIPRFTTNANVVLAPADPNFPRWDAIVLDQNGVDKITGVPAAFPTFPQGDSCHIVLTYVNVPAGSPVPGNVSDVVIYDQFVNGEWDSLAVKHGIMVDPVNPNFPIHLTLASYVSHYADSANSYFEFHTATPVDLNQFGALKFYVRDSVREEFIITWLLDNQPLGPPAIFVTDVPSSISYSEIVMPIATSWQFVTGTLANTLRFQVVNIQNPARGFYIDWIQLQGGLIATPPPNQGVQTLRVGNLPPIFTTTITFAPTNPQINFFLSNACAGCALINNGLTPAPPIYDKVSLTNSVKDLLNVANIDAQSTNGLYVGTSGGVTQLLPFTTDTIYAANGLHFYPVANSKNDTMTLGGKARDTANLLWNTFLGLHSFNFVFTQGTGNVFSLKPNGANNAVVADSSARFEQAMGASFAAANNLTLGADGNLFIVSGATQINAITTANWQPGSIVQLEFSGTPLLKNNTAGGAGTAPLLLAGSVDYQTSAGDVITFAYDGSNWHETSRKQTGGATVPTLQQVFNTQPGSLLTKSDTILTHGNTLRIVDTTSGTFMVSMQSGTGSTTGTVLQVIGRGTSNEAVTITSSNGQGPLQITQTGTPASNTKAAIIVGQSVVAGSTSADGIQVNFNGLATAAGTLGQPAGIDVYSVVGTAAIFRVDSTTNNVMAPVVQLLRTSSGHSGRTGLGGSIDWYNVDSTGATSGLIKLANQITSAWSDARDATRKSQMAIYGVASAVTNPLEILDGDGAITMPGSGTPSNTLLVQNTTGTGIGVTVTGSGTALNVSSTTGLPAVFNNNPASTNTVVETLRIVRASSGTAAAGLGGMIDYFLQTSTGATSVSNEIKSSWTNATNGSQSSKLVITGVLSAVTGNIFQFNGDGSAQMTPMTATAASAITPAEGMMLFVSSTNGTFTSIGFWGFQNGAWHAF